MSKSKDNELEENLHHLRMDWLTAVGKQVLPEGYWGDSGTAQQRDEPGRVYLTFDDGPCPETTPALLEMLSQQRTTATFFLMGSNVAKYPHLAADIVRQGHTIGNHTYLHPFLPLLTSKAMEREICRTNEVLKEATGVAPKLFRPPFGIIDGRTARLIKELAMQTVYWSTVTEDWVPIGAERVVKRALKRLSHGSLIVMHEGRVIARQTVSAARQIIEKSRAQGFEFYPVGLR